jgi:hypothetical protein
MPATDASRARSRTMRSADTSTGTAAALGRQEDAPAVPPARARALLARHAVLRRHGSQPAPRRAAHAL